MVMTVWTDIKSCWKL